MPESPHGQIVDSGWIAKSLIATFLCVSPDDLAEPQRESTLFGSASPGERDTETRPTVCGWMRRHNLGADAWIQQRLAKVSGTVYVAFWSLPYVFLCEYCRNGVVTTILW